MPRSRAASPFAIVFATIVSGAAQALIMPPIGAWWLSPFVMIPALWATWELRGWRALGAGWLMGATSVLALGYWIAPTAVHFAHLPWIVGVAALAIYAVVFGAYAGVFLWGLRPLRQIAGKWWPLPAAALWVGCEFLNPQMFAHHLGLAFHDRPSIFLLTAITGVGGVGFLIVLANCVLVEGLRTRAVPWGSAGVALAAVGLSIGYGTHRGTQIVQAQAGAHKHRIALVQDNFDVADRARLSREGPATIPNALVEQSRHALAIDRSIDVVVWGESALEGTPITAHTKAVRDLALEHGVEVWTGGHAWDNLRRFNAAFRIHGGGVVDPPYQKNLLVPFGEYLPLGEAFPFLQRVWGRGRNEPGTEQPVFDSAVGKFSFLICYEAIKSAYVRPLANRSIDLLVNLTYDGWFGDTSCPHLHLAAAALQSAQLGVPMVRVSSTGISAFIDARGVVTSRTNLFSQAVLVADVPRVTASSVYRTSGDWFPWTCIAVIALLTLVGSRRGVLW